MILPPLVPSPNGHIAGHNAERTEINANTAARDRTRLTQGMETIPRLTVVSGAVSTVTQNLRIVPTYARRNEQVTKMHMMSGVTAAAATPTLVRTGIYYREDNGNWTLVASTPNDTALLAAANTKYVKNLSAPLNLVEGRIYGVGILVVSAAAAPTMQGIVLPTDLAAMTPQLGILLAGKADLPASFTAAEGSAGVTGHLPWLAATA